MYHTRRAVPAVLLAATLATTAAACSTPAGSTGAKVATATPKPTASKGPLAGLTAEQIAAKGIADIEAAGSVHVSGTVAESGKKLTFDLTLVHGKGCQGSLSESKYSFKLVYIGKKVWIKPDRAFYKSVGGVNSAALSILSGKWLEVKAKGSNLGSFATMCKLSKLLQGFKTSAPVSIVKGPTVTVGGQRAVKIMDTGDSAYVLVSETATPELIRVVGPGSGGGTFSFTAKDSASKITTPPASKVLDAAKYGF